jgi:hypothetical protein
LVGAKHYRDDPFFRRGDGDRRAGGYVFLVEAFVEPDLVFARGLLGVGFDDLLVVPRDLDEGGVFKKGLCVGMTLKVVKGFDGKEYPVHGEEQCIEENLINPFLHV